ncbi:MAG: HAMP domain-containing histidine kinase [Ruminococcaceae bacterium]|nr:HAMP domain-containing histidine kinase [Oscillospiraceae bacterium]
MRQRLFKKYFFTVTAILIFTFVSFVMILSVVFNNYLIKEKYSSMEKTCTTVTDFLENTELEPTAVSRGMYYIVSNMADAASFDIFIADTDGKVLLCACDDWHKAGRCKHSVVRISEQIIDSVSSDKYSAIHTLNIYEQPHNIYADSVKKDGKAVAVVFCAASTLPLRSLMGTVIKLFLVSAAIPIIIMFFALYIMTYRLTKPLKLMSEASKAMARGDFSKRIPVTSDDEIGELAVSFNQMTNSLAQLESMRKSFVANISHELKTPMTTIGGFIDGIIDGTIESSKQDYYLGIVSEEVKRLSRMVHSMLSVSKLESGEFVLKPEVFDFKELLLSVVISQEQRIEKKEISIKGLDEIGSVSLNADRDLIYQVIYNLVDNAIKFVDDRGQIDFKLRVDSKKMLFEISNSGKGIPAEELRYVFERFYKTDKSRSANKNSAGLGLYIVKTILHAHGGKISVTSRENEFTAFKITLPLSK